MGYAGADCQSHELLGPDAVILCLRRETEHLYAMRPEFAVEPSTLAQVANHDRSGTMDESV